MPADPVDDAPVPKIVMATAHSVTPSQREAAVDLLVAEVGDYFLSGSLDAFEVVALDGSTVIGAAVGATLSDDDRQYMLDHLDRCEPSGQERSIIDDLRADVPAGHLLALAVARDARRRGLGALLIEARVEEFRRRGYGLAVAESWDKAEHSSVGVYDRIGFERLGEVPRYWFVHDAEAGGSLAGCPICGSPCTCSAVLFAKRLS